MSTLAQVSIGLLLLLAGLISVVAAVLGNPIRIGKTALPGPEGKQARAAVAGLGSVALAACAVVFILGGSEESASAGAEALPHPTPSSSAPAVSTESLTQTGSVSGSVGGLPALPPTTTPTPTGSPKPPATPSTAPPVPGRPTVTSIAVTKGTMTGCALTYHASIKVANGATNVTYVISRNGFVEGPNPRSISVTGTTANLDDFIVDARSPGEVAYNVLSPNAVSETKSWTVPTTCQPALNIGRPYVADVRYPSGEQLCGGAQIDVRANLSVISPPPGINVRYHLVVDGHAFASRYEYFPVGSTLVGDTITLSASAPDGQVSVSYVVETPVGDSAQANLVVPCHTPPPPPPPTTPSTETTTEDPPPYTPPVEPTTEDPGPVDTGPGPEDPPAGDT